MSASRERQSAGGRRNPSGSYLINAPEGFARLVLEHRCRPGPGLRALLLTSLAPGAQGGLAGLLLRLRQDGHAALRVVGPAAAGGGEALTAPRGSILRTRAAAAAALSAAAAQPSGRARAATAAKPGAEAPVTVAPLAAAAAAAVAAADSSDSTGGAPVGGGAGGAWTTSAASSQSSGEDDGDVDAGSSGSAGGRGAGVDAGARGGGVTYRGMNFTLAPGGVVGAGVAAAAASGAHSGGGGGGGGNGGGKGGAGADTGTSGGGGGGVYVPPGCIAPVQVLQSATGLGRKLKFADSSEDEGGDMDGGGAAGGGTAGGTANGTTPNVRMAINCIKDSSSSSSSSEEDTSSSSSGSEDAAGGAAARLGKRARGGGGGAAAPAAAALSRPPAGSKEDLFSQLDHLFMSRAGFAPGGRGAAAAAAAAMLGPAGGRGGRGRSGRAGRGGRAAEGAAKLQAAAATVAAAAAAAPAQADAGFHKKLGASAHAVPMDASFRAQAPLGYLIYLKPTRQALLLASPQAAADADALAAHPATALLAAAPPGLLMAVVHLTAPPLARRQQYKSLVRQLSGPHVWVNGYGHAAGGGDGGDAARPRAKAAAGDGGGGAGAGAPEAAAVADKKEAAGQSAVPVASAKASGVGSKAGGGPTLGLGHLGSCRVSMRLNAIAPALFPLPFVLRRQGAGSSGAAAPAALHAGFPRLASAAEVRRLLAPPPLQLLTHRSRQQHHHHSQQHQQQHHQEHHQQLEQSIHQPGQLQPPSPWQHQHQHHHATHPQPPQSPYGHPNGHTAPYPQYGSWQHQPPNQPYQPPYHQPHGDYNGGGGTSNGWPHYSAEAELAAAAAAYGPLEAAGAVMRPEWSYGHPVASATSLAVPNRQVAAGLREALRRKAASAAAAVPVAGTETAVPVPVAPRQSQQPPMDRAQDSEHGAAGTDTLDSNRHVALRVRQRLKLGGPVTEPVPAQPVAGGSTALVARAALGSEAALEEGAVKAEPSVPVHPGSSDTPAADATAAGSIPAPSAKEQTITAVPGAEDAPVEVVAVVVSEALVEAEPEGLSSEEAAAALAAYKGQLSGRAAAGPAGPVAAAAPGADGVAATAAAQPTPRPQPEALASVDDIGVPPCLRPATAEAAAGAAGATAGSTAPVGDVSVLFLGTGSAEPSKYRGASAVLLRGLRRGGSSAREAADCAEGGGPGGGGAGAAGGGCGGSGAAMLIDAGEGTYGALVRWLGPKGAAAQVAALALVWLSHKHPDHILGLPALLEARPADAPPLLVVGPQGLIQARRGGRGARGATGRGGRGSGRDLDSGWDAAAAAAAAAWPPPPRGGADPSWEVAQGRAAAAAVCGSLGLVRWQSVAVHHCRDAWGLVVEHADGWKLVYSGDTRPCPALVAAGRGATLLIHEATFEPCLEQQARGKRHSTSAEAAAVAAAMRAYRTVLTHFSQRYPRVPGGIDAWALPLRCRPAIAFDGMLLPLAALPALPHVMPPLALALGEPPQQPTAAVAGLALEEENVTEGGQDEQEVVLD
eukprot:XP_001698937.1 beta-lactamase protein [Chlamydomonas reinhardtii]